MGEMNMIRHIQHSLLILRFQNLTFLQLAKILPAAKNIIDYSKIVSKIPTYKAVTQPLIFEDSSGLWSSQLPTPPD